MHAAPSARGDSWGEDWGEDAIILAPTFLSLACASRDFASSYQGASPPTCSRTSSAGLDSLRAAVSGLLGDISSSGRTSARECESFLGVAGVPLALVSSIGP